VPSRKKNKQPSQALDDTLLRAPLAPAPPVTTINSAIAGFAAWAFTALMLIGYIGFRVEGTTAFGNRMSIDRAMFTVVNASTLTGFQGNLAIDHYNPRGQWLILLLTIGGTQFALIAGGTAVARIAKLPFSDGAIVATSIGVQLAVMLIGMIALHLPDQPVVTPLLQSTSAFGNSGVWMGPSPELMNAATHLLLLPLALLGGFGIPVLMDLVISPLRGRALSNHTLAVLKLTAIVYLLGVGVMFVFRAPTSNAAAKTALASASEVAINTRSAGLPIEFAADFPRYLQWALIGLMIIGAAPGSSGGGLKITTIGRLFGGVLDAVRGMNPGRIFGIAVVWMLVFFAVVLACFLTLLWTEPGLDADRLFFIAVSAASNCGLAHDRVGIVGTGLYAITLTMLVGRILPIGVLWWVVRYADETDVAIG